MTDPVPVIVSPLGRRDLPLEIFEQTLDALSDGILVVDAERRVLYVNVAFMDHWRLPSGLRAQSHEPDMLRHACSQLVDPDRFLKEIERLHPSDRPSQDELLFKDGRILARRSFPFCIDGAVGGRIWIFTDITAARHSLLDPLSGVASRRAFSEQFPRLAEGFCDGLLKCIAILDIDYFKAYNDHYGHAAGDEVLKRVGALLRAKLGRSDDYIFRIGGEEFVLGCRARTEREVVRTMEGVRSTIADARIEHVGNQPYNIVTVSIGFIVFRGARAPAEIFDRSDDALYRAKYRGRNNIYQADNIID